jgi:signal peptidase I
MHWDFSTILVIAALLTGGIWLLDSIVLAPRRAMLRPVGETTRPARKADRAGGEPENPPGPSAGGPVITRAPLPWYVDLSRSFFPIILAVLILRSFLIEPFRIPSGSMMPTLLAGDFILVNKYAFGMRLPVLGTKILDSGSPQRGDVAVFRYPEDPSVAYIKRIVGLPGDVIAYRNKQLFVNDRLVPQQPDFGNEAMVDGYEIRLEQLPTTDHQTVDHLIQVNRRYPGMLPDLALKVPEGHYFAMGDNRDNSRDSRFWGPLPEENLIGKAFLIWMNWDCVTFNGHCNRIGRSIQ